MLHGSVLDCTIVCKSVTLSTFGTGVPTFFGTGGSVVILGTLCVYVYLYRLLGVSCVTGLRLNERAKGTVYVFCSECLSAGCISLFLLC